MTKSVLLIREAWCTINTRTGSLKTYALTCPFISQRLNEEICMSKIYQLAMKLDELKSWTNDSLIINTRLFMQHTRLITSNPSTDTVLATAWVLMLSVDWPCQCPAPWELHRHHTKTHIAVFNHLNVDNGIMNIIWDIRKYFFVKTWPGYFCWG